MAAINEVDELIEQFHLAQVEFLKGNSEPVKKLFSHREIVTQRWLDGRHRDHSQVVIPELAYVVEIERARAKVGGREDIAPGGIGNSELD